jgi:hypothetical protein
MNLRGFKGNKRNYKIMLYAVGILLGALIGGGLGYLGKCSGSGS